MHSRSALVGIDDIAVHIPRLFLDMRTFAALRGEDYDKLRTGLGLAAMAVPDVHEDPATMGANAVARLIDRNELDPRRIGRIYLGTESALDGAKPTATYILDMLTQRYAERYGEDCFGRCDAVDMTFACIGAVDALHNTLDWVARGGVDEDRIGIVVFADNAKYERFSSGEYTQGAGGGALLVRHAPRLLAIRPQWGVSTRSVHDFYKPVRRMPVQDLFRQVLDLARDTGADLPPDLEQAMVRRLREADHGGLFDADEVQLHKDTPLFDGPFSNRCYRDAVKSAFEHFQAQLRSAGEVEGPLTDAWARIVLHLPYAYQGKRMFPDIYRYDRQHTDGWSEVVAELGPAPVREAFDDPGSFERARESYRRRLSRTAAYRAFVDEKIEKGQRASSLVGNQYTGSLFLALMSTLEADLAEGKELAGARIGLCGYGSGAKAKVFEGTVQPGWKAIASRFQLFARLEGRIAIDGSVYEALHRGSLPDSVRAPAAEFVLDGVEPAGPHEGSRAYRWAA